MIKGLVEWRIPVESSGLQIFQMIGGLENIQMYCQENQKDILW